MIKIIGYILLLLLIIIIYYWLKSIFHFGATNKKPESEKWWTILYYGARGSGKSLHQAKLCVAIFKYLDYIYRPTAKIKIPHRAIVFSIQRFNKEIEDARLVYKFGFKIETDPDGNKTLVANDRIKRVHNPVGNLYYWNDARDLRYCPRIVCWRGQQKHRTHHAYIIFDDMATILPADNWQSTPIWMRKMFAQARHFGIRIISNAQDPFSLDINFRRYCDMAFRFRKIIGSPDPDETKPPIKHIWGVYTRRKIKAELLWKMGDMPEEDIKRMRESEKQRKKVDGSYKISDVWKATPHWIGKTICNIYDTTQDVPEYHPTGYEHTELGCLDPAHNHTDKKASNYCGYNKVIHTLV